MLLGREEVNHEWPDNSGRTLLSYPAGEPYREVVKMLPRHEEVNPDEPDVKCRIPLSYAAEGLYGHYAEE